MLNETRETQQTQSVGQYSQKPINGKLVIVVLALPLFVTFGLHAVAISNFLVDNAPAILTWTGVILTGTGALGNMVSLPQLVQHYTRRESYSDQERSDAFSATTSLVLIMSGGIVLILRGNFWDAVAVAILCGGTLIVVMGLAMILAEDRLEGDARIPALARMGQLAAMFGAVLASVGIVINDN